MRADLETIAAIAALDAPIPLQTRIDIATGVVVIGDLIGSGSAQEPVVLIAGEAGIGKSRLTAALSERLAPEPHKVTIFLLAAIHRQSAILS